MTERELQADFEKQFAAQIKKGLQFSGVFPLPDKDGLAKNVKEDAQVHPLTHRLFLSRPFIFDIRQLPKSFCGFKLSYVVPVDTIPDEFRLDEEDILPFDICWSAENIIAYAEKHAPDICEQLSDYTLTLKDICDMIADGDFERHKKLCEEERVKRISAATSEEDED